MDVQPGNLQQLSGAILSVWLKTCDECFQHFAESVPSRMKAALKAKETPIRNLYFYVCVHIKIKRIETNRITKSKTKCCKK